MKIENENILNDALANGINLFLGAGFSTRAHDSSKRTLPLANTLRDELVDQFNIPDFSELPLPQLCTYLKSTNRDALLSYLTNRFTVASFDPAYQKLSSIAAKWIFTTNIDDLVFQIYKSSATHYINDIDSRGPVYGDAKAVQYVALHGCVRHPERGFIFGAEELASAFAEDNDRWHFLTQALQERPTLFIGYGVNDAAVLNSLSPKAVAGRPTKEKWLLVHPSSQGVASEAVFRALGFSIILGDTLELLQLFSSSPKAVPSFGKVSDIPTKKMFPGEAVPRLGEVPLRPVKEFFLGAPPEWSDIYSQTIHQTSHFTSVKNMILNGKNIAVVGAPACGKSTLLMQLAAGLETKKRKLFLASITEEKAENISVTLNGEPCLIFVDNFADVFDGIEVLARTPNIQVVGADRDFVFGIISHKIKDLNFNVCDVTELTEADLQKCVSSIPSALAVNGLLNTPNRIRPSLFEVIEANVNQPSLKRRFKKVLTDLAKSDISKVDMLVMMCYVFSCRTPVSMDMLIAFCRNETSDWQEVAKMRKHLGGMITEYFGEHASSDQDYFCPRSSHVAEAVLDVVSSADLRRVLEQFHQEVSPARTCRFDLFRRRAFSADIFVKAFPEWVEGKAFYDKLVSRDPSPFFYQQAALYLSHQERHSEAFTMIDLALTGSQGRIWSIRNSHAIILFRANISFVAQAAARKSLKKSMDTLAECYRWDKRKAFHAFTFAQQALQLWKCVVDTETESYMRQAKIWLTETLVEEPWNRQCRYLLPKIAANTN